MTFVRQHAVLKHVECGNNFYDILYETRREGLDMIHVLLRFVFFKDVS